MYEPYNTMPNCGTSTSNALQPHADIKLVVMQIDTRYQFAQPPVVCVINPIMYSLPIK